MWCKPRSPAVLSISKSDCCVHTKQTALWMGNEAGIILMWLNTAYEKTSQEQFLHAESMLTLWYIVCSFSGSSVRPCPEPGDLPRLRHPLVLWQTSKRLCPVLVWRMWGQREPLWHWGWMQEDMRSYQHGYITQNYYIIKPRHMYISEHFNWLNSISILLLTQPMLNIYSLLSQCIPFKGIFLLICISFLHSRLNWISEHDIFILKQQKQTKWTKFMLFFLLFTICPETATRTILFFQQVQKICFKKV